MEKKLSAQNCVSACELVCKWKWYVFTWKMVEWIVPKKSRWEIRTARWWRLDGWIERADGWCFLSYITSTVYCCVLWLDFALYRMENPRARVCRIVIGFESIVHNDREKPCDKNMETHGLRKSIISALIHTAPTHHIAHCHLHAIHWIFDYVRLSFCFFSLAIVHNCGLRGRFSSTHFEARTRIRDRASITSCDVQHGLWILYKVKAHSMPSHIHTDLQ